ncbi:MAG: DUF3455 domain-containing protein [Acidobacteria bacterium]|nr:DUF3455 domain-containing protein [Acidobacteriota bacterium]
MNKMKIVSVVGLVVLLAASGFAINPIQDTRVSSDIAPPSLPAPVCSGLQVQAGNEVAFHAYALGVQIYRWNGAGWGFVAPEATLYASPNYRGKVGTHYAGPTWESNSGSNVVAQRLAGCSVDSTAVDWLLLQAVSTDGPGVFNGTTYVQRVNTVGGKAPVTPGAFIGAEARVPYTAEYFFYKATN